MPDRGKVIERLQNVSHYFKSMLKAGYDGDADMYREHRESVKMAIALLKEQEAVEPKVIRMNAFGHPVHACGKCGLLITESMNYCSRCGRSVKWSG